MRRTALGIKYTEAFRTDIYLAERQNGRKPKNGETGGIKTVKNTI